MLTFFHGWQRKMGVLTLVAVMCLFASSGTIPVHVTHVDVSGRMATRSEEWALPIWWYGPPMALLSAYLLLSKPRQKPNQADDKAPITPPH